MSVTGSAAPQWRCAPRDRRALWCSFQLAAEDPADRLAALEAIDDDPDESHLPLVAERLELEEDPEVRAALDPASQADLIEFRRDRRRRASRPSRGLRGNVSLGRARHAQPAFGDHAAGGRGRARGCQYRRVLEPGRDLDRIEAYELLAEEGLVPPLVTPDDIRAALEANIDGTTVGGVQVATLNTDEARARAYAALVAEGLAEPAPMTPPSTPPWPRM